MVRKEKLQTNKNINKAQNVQNKDYQVLIYENVYGFRPIVLKKLNQSFIVLK